MSSRSSCCCALRGFLPRSVPSRLATATLQDPSRVDQVTRWLLAGTLAFLAGCGGLAPEPVTLRIGFFPTVDFLPYFVMQEQGFDKQNGLRFEEATYPGGAAAIDAMAAGRLDVCPGVAIPPILVAAERGLVPGKVVVVAANDFADPDHPGIGVVVRAPVRNWRDLLGKKIATNAKGSIATAAVAGRLQQEGVGDYTWVETAFSNMGLAVAGGNVEAAGMAEPFLTQSLLRGDGVLLGWVVGGPPFERTPFTSIVFSAELQRRNPGAVKAFLRAHLRAVKWMGEHPEQARGLLARRLNLSREVGQKMNLLRWSADARNDPALLDGMQSPLVSIGMIKAPIPATRLYDETLLGQVLAEPR
jgi:NitT/TauT family transport system substrate-binding protein